MGLLNRTLVRDSPLISMSQSRGSSKRLRSLLVSRHNSSGRFRGELKNLEGEGRVTRTGILERAHQIVWTENSVLCPHPILEIKDWKPKKVLLIDGV